jgi:erythronate-4-phosphate dehydrogenase
MVDVSKIHPSDLNVGIIGVGAVGSHLERLLRKLSIHYEMYDPPRSVRESRFESCSITDLNECNILSFHTPLERNSSHPTFHLFDQVDGFWSKRQIGIINAARGGVLNEKLHLERIDNGLLDHLILDVWENEPIYSTSVRQKCLLATPHIAGYSFEAKLRASYQAVEFLANQLGLNAIGDFDKWVQIFSMEAEKQLPMEKASKWAILHKAEEYHAFMKAIDPLDKEHRRQAFQNIRKQTALRREWAYQKLDESLYTAFPLMRML